MAIYGAVEDLRRVRLPNANGRLGVDAVLATFTGTTTVQFKNMDSVVFAILDQNTGTAPGLGPSTFTYTVSGNTVSVFAWQPTSATAPALVAATTAATVGVVAIGVRRQGLTQ